MRITPLSFFVFVFYLSTAIFLRASEEAPSAGAGGPSLAERSEQSVVARFEMQIVDLETIAVSILNHQEHEAFHQAIFLNEDLENAEDFLAVYRDALLKRLLEKKAASGPIPLNTSASSVNNAMLMKIITELKPEFAEKKKTQIVERFNIVLGALTASELSTRIYWTVAELMNLIIEALEFNKTYMARLDRSGEARTTARWIANGCSHIVPVSTFGRLIRTGLMRLEVGCPIFLSTTDPRAPEIKHVLHKVRESINGQQELLTGNKKIKNPAREKTLRSWQQASNDLTWLIEKASYAFLLPFGHKHCCLITTDTDGAVIEHPLAIEDQLPSLCTIADGWYAKLDTTDVNIPAHLAKIKESWLKAVPLLAKDGMSVSTVAYDRATVPAHAFFPPPVLETPLNAPAGHPAAVAREESHQKEAAAIAGAIESNATTLAEAQTAAMLLQKRIKQKKASLQKEEKDFAEQVQKIEEDIAKLKTLPNKEFKALEEKKRKTDERKIALEKLLEIARTDVAQYDKQHQELLTNITSLQQESAAIAAEKESLVAYVKKISPFSIEDFSEPSKITTMFERRIKKYAECAPSYQTILESLGLADDSDLGSYQSERKAEMDRLLEEQSAQAARRQELEAQIHKLQRMAPTVEQENLRALLKDELAITEAQLSSADDVERRTILTGKVAGLQVRLSLFPQPHDRRQELALAEKLVTATAALDEINKAIANLKETLAPIDALNTLANAQSYQSFDHHRKAFETAKKCLLCINTIQTKCQHEEAITRKIALLEENKSETIARWQEAIANLSMQEEQFAIVCEKLAMAVQKISAHEEAVGARAQLRTQLQKLKTERTASFVEFKEMLTTSEKQLSDHQLQITKLTKQSENLIDQQREITLSLRSKSITAKVTRAKTATLPEKPTSAPEDPEFRSILFSCAEEYIRAWEMSEISLRFKLLDRRVTTHYERALAVISAPGWSFHLLNLEREILASFLATIIQHRLRYIWEKPHTEEEMSVLTSLLLPIFLRKLVESKPEDSGYILYQKYRPSIDKALEIYNNRKYIRS